MHPDLRYALAEARLAQIERSADAPRMGRRAPSRQGKDRSSNRGGATDVTSVGAASTYNGVVR